MRRMDSLRILAVVCLLAWVGYRLHQSRLHDKATSLASQLRAQLVSMSKDLRHVEVDATHRKGQGWVLVVGGCVDREDLRELVRTTAARVAGSMPVDLGTLRVDELCGLGKPGPVGSPDLDDINRQIEDMERDVPKPGAGPTAPGEPR